VTLTDTGPLVALLNRNDPNHALCMGAGKTLPSGPLVTTWPCFTEAMYLLDRAGGFAGQEALWKLLEAARLVLYGSVSHELGRMAELMRKYRDLPMDLADASLIEAAEKVGTRQVFTLDRHFHVYRFADGTAVDVVPWSPEPRGSPCRAECSAALVPSPPCSSCQAAL
jgi:predicted nucleic acid-binding protein